MERVETDALDLSLPYSTPDLPGIGGELRATPSHFVVEELPLYEPSGEGQHLYINLTKEGYTSREVQRQLADLFQRPLKAVGFAGMKDKVARTTQTFSVDVGFVRPEFVEEAAGRIRDHLPVTFNWARLHRNKLKLGHLLGNRFHIVVVNVPGPPAEALTRANAIAQRLDQEGLPNFFGPQRFGTDGTNVRRGRDIVAGLRTTKDRWLHRLLVSGFQSYLCNRYLVLRMESGAFQRILTGDVAKKYDTGGMFDVQDGAVEQLRYEGHEISFTAPIFGPKMWATTGEAAQLEERVPAAAGVTTADFGNVGIDGTRRMGRLLVPDLQITLVPEGVRVQFTLRKGSYATTVLREIMKVDLAEVPDNGPANGEE